MIIDILTLFPEMFEVPMKSSMMKKAQDMKVVKINIHNLRKWAKDKHKTVDDRPFGGGKGMVIRVDIVYQAIKSLKKKDTHIILLSPQGVVFNQAKARQLTKFNHLILIAGHYEGFDERIRQQLINEQVSIGNYVLTGGELPAMIITDAVVRLLPKVLDPQATKNESFSHTPTDNLQSPVFDYPTYTRPVDFMGWTVPDILLSGNHKQIEKWRKVKAQQKTRIISK